MLQKYKAKREEGFTIIEVLIVLAIAGLIILIVFLAVPALQRNSRNTQRRDDVSKLLGAVQEHANNNNGNLPTVPGDVTGLIEFAYYDPASEVALAGYGGSEEDITDPDNVKIVTGASCGTISGGNQGAVSGQTRSYVAIFAVETGGTPEPQCQQS